MRFSKYSHYFDTLTLIAVATDHISGVWRMVTVSYDMFGGAAWFLDKDPLFCLVSLFVS